MRGSKHWKCSNRNCRLLQFAYDFILQSCVRLTAHNVVNVTQIFLLFNNTINKYADYIVAAKFSDI